MSKDAQAEYMALANAGHDGPQIAARMGVSKQRVWQLSGETGVPHESGKGRYRVKKGEIRNPARHEYGVALQPSWSGTVTEMVVATDLVKRGYFIYIPLARTGPFDMLACGCERTMRVEVKSILSRGHLAKMEINNNCDLIARVMADGEIVCSNDPGVVVQGARADGRF